MQGYSNQKQKFMEISAGLSIEKDYRPFLRPKSRERAGTYKN